MLQYAADDADENHQQSASSSHAASKTASSRLTKYTAAMQT